MCFDGGGLVRGVSVTLNTLEILTLKREPTGTSLKIEAPDMKIRGGYLCTSSSSPHSYPHLTLEHLTLEH